MKLLLIEDSKEVAELIFDYLEDAGYELDYANNGDQGYWLATEQRYDCIVLDLMLPGMDGLTVCERLRDMGENTPIVMLTARDSNHDMLAGLSKGADDYIVKPFDLAILEARINAVVRRSGKIGFSKKLTVGPISLDLESRQVVRDEHVLNINRAGFDILKLLLEKYPCPASREEIMQTIWKDDLHDDDLLRKHIYQLRQVVDKPFEQKLIKTMPKIGYGLDC